MDEFAQYEPILPQVNKDALQYYSDLKIELPNNQYFNDYYKVEPSLKEEIPYIKQMKENHPLVNKSFVVPIPYKDLHKDYKDFNIEIGKNARIATVHNNPGNLMYVGQPLATKGEPKKGGGYWAKFASPEAGWYALMQQINLDKTRNLSIKSFLNKYAPSNENNTNRYIKTFTKHFNVSPETNLSQLDTLEVTKLIAQIESGTILSPKQT